MPVTTPRPIAAGGLAGGSARQAGGRREPEEERRRRHRRRHRDCSRGDCYLPTGTNTQPPLLPPREPLPELPARTPGDRCDRPGPGPTGECGGRRGSGSGIGTFTPNVRGGAPAGPVSPAQFRRRGGVWGSLGATPRPFTQTRGQVGTVASLFRKLPELGAPEIPLSLLPSRSYQIPDLGVPLDPSNFYLQTP